MKKESATLGTTYHSRQKRKVICSWDFCIWPSVEGAGEDDMLGSAAQRRALYRLSRRRLTMGTYLGLELKVARSVIQ